MAKVQSDSVIALSIPSALARLRGRMLVAWEDADRKALETAAGSLLDLRAAEVIKMDTKVDNGKVTAFTHPRCSLV